MRTIDTGWGDITLADICFLYSDTRMAYTANTDDVKTMEVTANGIKETREVKDRACAISLYPFIRSVAEMENINRGDVNGSRGTVTLSVVLAKADGTRQGYTVTQGYIVGSYGIHDDMNRHRVLWWNPNFPFTIDMDMETQYTDTDGNGWNDIHVTIDRNKAVTVPVMLSATKRYGIASVIDNTVFNVADIAILQHRTYFNGTETTGLHTIRLRMDKRTKGVYLRWLDHMGRVCYRLLEKKSEQTTVKSDNGFTRYVEQPGYLKENAGEMYNNGDDTHYQMTATRRMTLGLGMQSEDELRELNELSASPEVDMWCGLVDGKDIWERVTVVAATHSDTCKVLQEYAVQIDVKCNDIQQY